MKKNLKYLLLIPVLLFSSCNTTNSEVANSKWGTEAAQACYNTIGTVIPYLESDGFEYEVTTDGYGDPAIWFYLYYDTQEIADQKLIEYAYAAYEQRQYRCEVKMQWYQIPEEYSYIEVQTLFADKILNEYNAVEIQGIASQKAYKGTLKGCLGLFCFNYFPNIDKTKFPNNAVNHLLGETIPELVGNDLEYDFSFYVDDDGYHCLTIAVTGKGSSYMLEEEYLKTLLSNGYTIYPYNSYTEEAGSAIKKASDYQGYEDGMYYYAYPNSNSHVIVFYYSLYYSAFIIDIANLNK